MRRGYHGVKIAIRVNCPPDLPLLTLYLKATNHSIKSPLLSFLQTGSRASFRTRDPLGRHRTCLRLRVDSLRIGECTCWPSSEYSSGPTPGSPRGGGRPWPP